MLSVRRCSHMLQSGRRCRNPLSPDHGPLCHVHNRIQMSREELLTTTRPISHESWRHAVSSMMAWDDEAELVQALGQQLERNGCYDYPVILDPDTARIINGNHRCVAFVLSEETDIAVSVGYPQNTQEVSLVCNFQVLNKQDGPRSETETFAYMVSLRSFPLLSGGWAHSDGGSYSHEKSLVQYWVPRDEQSSFPASLVAFARGKGLQIKVLSVQKTGRG